MESLGITNFLGSIDLQHRCNMGNTKSKSRRLVRHEKLDEDNEKYFAKVQSRNSGKKKKVRRSRRKKREQKNEHQHQQPSPTRSVFTLDDERQPNSIVIRTGANVPGPLLNNTMIDVPPSFARSQLRRRQQRERKEKSSRKRNEALALSHSSSGLESPLRNTPRQRLRQSRPALSSVTSSSSWSPSPRNGIHDYYTDMIAECSSSDRRYTFDSDENSVWAQVNHGSKVSALSFSGPHHSTNNSLLAVGSETGKVVILEVFSEEGSGTMATDLAAKRVRHAVEFQRDGKVRSLSFSPDRQWLVAGGDDCTASLIQLSYSSEAGELRRTAVQYELEREDRVYAVQFDSSGSRVAVGGFDGKLAIAELRSGNNTASLELIVEIERKGLILSLDWSSDGSRLVLGGSDSVCTVIDTSSWQVVAEIQLSSSLPAVSFNPSGSLVAAGTNNGMVFVVDVASQSIVAEIVREEMFNKLDASHASTSQTGSCRMQAVNWSDDGHFIALGGSDDRCIIVETSSYAVVHEIRRSGSINCLAWSSTPEQQGHYLAVGSDDCSVLITRTFVQADDGCSSYYDSDDTSSSASSSVFSDGSVSHHEWILRDDSFIDADEMDLALPISPLNVATDQDLPITAICFSRGKRTSTSEYIVVAGKDSVVTVFSTFDWEPVTQLTFSKPIHSMHFSYQSEFLALAGESGIVYVFDVATWQLVKEAQLSYSSIQRIQFSRHDQRLAVGSSDGVLTLLDPIVKWEVTGEIEASDSPILSLDWSSRHLAIGRQDGTITIYEADKVYANFFVSQVELTNGNTPVRSMTFGSRGRFLACGNDDGKVTIYSGRGGWTANHLIGIGTQTPILDIRWTSDGQYLAFGGSHPNMSPRIIDTTSWANVKDAKAFAGNGISALAWSNDDRYLVLASPSGDCSVVDTEGWTFIQTLSYKKKLPQGTSPVDPRSELLSAARKGVSQSASASGVCDKDVLSHVEMHRPWSQTPQVTRFLQTSALFLCDVDDIVVSHPLQVRVPCIAMLTLHVKWLLMNQPDVDVISNVDSGEHLRAILRMLDVASALMVQEMEGGHLTESNSAAPVEFDLDEQDRRSIMVWNDFWRLQDSTCPLIDTSLIRLSDQFE